MDEEVHTVQDWDNNGAKMHLAKTTERNVKLCKRRVRPATLHIGSNARYFRPCHYVDRWRKRQSNYFGPLLIIDIYSPETASKQRSQRPDARVLHTEEIEAIFMYVPCDWLENIAGPSDTHETGPLWSLGLVSVAEDPPDHLV